MSDNLREVQTHSLASDESFFEPAGQRAKLMRAARLLAYITGRVEKELLVRNEHLAAESPFGQNTQMCRIETAKDRDVAAAHGAPFYTPVPPSLWPLSPVFSIPDELLAQHRGSRLRHTGAGCASSEYAVCVYTANAAPTFRMDLQHARERRLPFHVNH